MLDGSELEEARQVEEDGSGEGGEEVGRHPVLLPLHLPATSSTECHTLHYTVGRIGVRSG